MADTTTVDPKATPPGTPPTTPQPASAPTPQVPPPANAGLTGDDAAKAALLNKLDQLETRISGLEQGGACLSDIRTQVTAARDLVQNGRLADAATAYQKASATTDRAAASIKAEPLARILLWVEVGYLVLILGLGYLVMRYPTYSLWVGLVGLNAKAAWFGAVGGVTIGIYGIYSHISAKDFDPSFRLWYLCKPIVGAIFGWFVVLIYYVGLVTAQGSQADVKTPEVTYAIAFLAGFSERFTIKTIDRLMTVLTAGDDKDKNKDKSKDKMASPAPPPKD